MRLRAAGLGSLGNVRQSNDDHYCLAQMIEQTALTVVDIDVGSRLFTDYGFLAAVADGMGGYNGGSFASRLVLESLVAQFYGEKHGGCSRDEFTLCVARYVKTATDVLCARLQRNPELSEAGTTLAGVALMPADLLVVFHVGDSRVLRCCSGYCRQLTVDHTPLGRDLAAGRLSVELAQALPQANQLTRSIGLIGDTSADILAGGGWADGERFLIATDGCFGLGRGVPGDHLTSLLTSPGQAEGLAASIMSAALETDGSDNATVVVVDLG